MVVNVPNTTAVYFISPYSGRFGITQDKDPSHLDKSHQQCTIKEKMKIKATMLQANLLVHN
jgi:hypothetical protein